MCVSGGGLRHGWSTDLTDGAIQELVLKAGVPLAAQAVHQAVLHLLQHAHPAYPLPAVPHPPCAARVRLSRLSEASLKE